MLSLQKDIYVKHLQEASCKMVKHLGVSQLGPGQCTVPKTIQHFTRAPRKQNKARTKNKQEQILERGKTVIIYRQDCL